MEGCSRCLGDDRRDCDIRPQSKLFKRFSYDPQPVVGEVLVPYRALFELDQLHNIQEAALKAGLRFEILTRPGNKYGDESSGQKRSCPSDKVRVSIGEGKHDATENRKMDEFWHNWHVSSGEFAKREESLREYMEQSRA